MEKSKHVLNWLLVVLLSAWHSSVFWGNPLSVDWAYFQQPKPFVYRVLAPLLARGLGILTGLPATKTVAIVVFISCLICYVGIFLLFTYYMGDKGFIYSLVAFALTFLATILWRKPYDMLSAGLVTLSIYAIVTGKDSLFLYLFPVAAINRFEANILIMAFFVLYRLYYLHDWREFRLRIVGWKYFIKGLLYQIAVMLVIPSVLMFIFRTSGGIDYAPFAADVPLVYFLHPGGMVVSGGVLLVILAAHVKWRRYYPSMRIYLFLFLFQFILHLVGGNPYELRVLAEVIPITVLFLVYS